MRMAVMDIRKVRVGVSDGHVNVRMRMRLRAVPFEIVFVLMVRVVAMPMRMLQPIMRVRVFVALAQM